MATDLPLPQNLMNGLLQLVEALDQRGLKYALIGGLAAGFRGRPRFTQDVDFLLQIPQLALPGLLENLLARGFAFDPATAIREWTRDHLTVLHYRGVRIDWLKPALPAYQHVLDRAGPVGWQGHTVRIATAEGLILLKLVAFRGQDQLDIQALLAAHQGKLELDWVRSEWATLADAGDARMTWFEEQLRRFYAVE